jgi:hypothetical protein
MSAWGPICFRFRQFLKEAENQRVIVSSVPTTAVAFALGCGQQTREGLLQQVEDPEPHSPEFRYALMVLIKLRMGIARHKETAPAV